MNARILLECNVHGTLTLSASRLIGLWLCLALLAFCTSTAMDEELPTLYEYYTSGGINSGLDDSSGPTFLLNGKELKIFSGALHYFRVPRAYWRDRLRKYRAAGLNTVETYVPWNLHEPEDGIFDFGNGTSDFTEFLDIAEFINLAKEEDLFVILRPGPYICAEWEFGGLPSWLLRYPGIKVRTNDEVYLNLVKRYFTKLSEIVSPLQFTEGGPIIAVQIENEYGNVKEIGKPIDTEYLKSLKKLLQGDCKIVELLFTSDTPSNGFYGTLPDVLATANFQKEPIIELALLKAHQPNKPLMVTEFWTGWFDHWSEKHHTWSVDEFGTVLDEILGFNSSFNFYMMHGGTNWGFMNGANVAGIHDDNRGFQPDITSYDYDAPLSESGQYTEKYNKLVEIIEKYTTIQLKKPSLPEPIKPIAYSEIRIDFQITLENLITQNVHIVNQETPLAMELLDINNNSGQSYGYIVYRKSNINLPRNSTLKIEGRVCDTVVVLVNGQLKSKALWTKSDLDGFGYWRLKDSTLELNNEELVNVTLDLVVENWGRSNYGKLHQFNQYKGLWQGNVLLNDNILSGWTIAPLEFKKKWTSLLTGWENFEDSTGPKLYKATLSIENEPSDTYLDLRGWTKGIVIVNNFVLARYCLLGPQYFAYLPAPFLKKGENEILIFEHFSPASSLAFSDVPIFNKKTTE